MEMLPAGQIVGDGQTPVILYVTALNNQEGPWRQADSKSRPAGRHQKP